MCQVVGERADFFEVISDNSHQGDVVSIEPTGFDGISNGMKISWIATTPGTQACGGSMNNRVGIKPGQIRRYCLI